MNVNQRLLLTVSSRCLTANMHVGLYLEEL